MTNIKSKINFGPGPAALPQEVLEEAAAAVINYSDSGLSILEIPHRGDLFDDILEESKQLVRELCGIGNDYEVLWMHGGGRLQFCMLPMNFLGEKETAAYVDSGAWSADAINNAQYYGQVKTIASSQSINYTSLPQLPASLNEDFAYLHFTTNNTIYGTQWKDIPAYDLPLIADMSSDIFSMQRNYNQFAMFYAVAQKNIGAAGVTLAVVHKDLLKQTKRDLPPMLCYKTHAQKNSVLNTPPVFAIYTSLLTLRWTKERGIAAIEQENRLKAKLLYEEIDRNSLFRSFVDGESRSLMNVVFGTGSKEHERAFLLFCEHKNITGIAGHRSVGGFRASLYNAVTKDDVMHLIAAMKEFESKYQ